jgi:hypothetical protein
MGDPTSSYATAGIALTVSGELKPHHHDKVKALSVGWYRIRYTIDFLQEFKIESRTV